MHTHATEAYAQNPDDPYPESGTARTTDPSHSIIRVGDEITRIFTEMGLNVIHDTTLYDYPSYNEAYTRSRAGIEAILAQHPTIQVVLDIHRDALVGSDGTIYKPVIELDGVSTAQVMMLVGSDDAGAEFPDWPEHLALVMSVQQQMNSLWPQLARPITLRTARFNQQLTKGSFLVEVGSHGNTLEEALAGARLFARAAEGIFGALRIKAGLPLYTLSPLLFPDKGLKLFSPPASHCRGQSTRCMVVPHHTYYMQAARRCQSRPPSPLFQRGCHGAARDG